MEQASTRFKNDQKSEKRKEKKEKTCENYYYNQASDWYKVNPGSEFSTGQWSSTGHRIFPTMSDSAVYGYPYPFEIHCKHPFCPPQSIAIQPECSRKLPLNRNNRKFDRFPNIDEMCDHNYRYDTNFTSLPPSDITERQCNEKGRVRRFSDPGLNNAGDSDESDTNSSSDESINNNNSLSEQVSQLRKENKYLTSQLEITRNELNNIKLELGSISGRLNSHEPQSLTQMIKEIKEAAEIRENVMLTRFQQILNNTKNSQNKNIEGESKSLKERLEKMEKQIEFWKSKFEIKINGQATSNEIHNDVENEMEINKEKISRSSSMKDEEKDEEVIMRPSINSLNGNNNNNYDSSSSTVSSLSSSMDCMSLQHVPHITLCGPVTDL